MAIALLMGGDPDRLLHRRSRFSLDVDQAVLRAAIDRRLEFERADREGLAVEIANRLGPMISTAMSQTVQAIARAMR